MADRSKNRASLDLIGAIAILASLKLLEIAQEWLWPDHVPTYLGVVPISFIVDTVDITVLIVFALFGLYDVYRELRGDSDAD